MGRRLSRAEPALLLLAPKQFVSLSWRSGDTSPGSAAPGSECKCTSNNEQLWGLTEMDVPSRGVGGKAWRQVPIPVCTGNLCALQEPTGPRGDRVTFSLGTWNTKTFVQMLTGLNRAVLMVVDTLSYFKKNMNNHTISLKSRWGVLNTDTGSVHHKSLFLL